MNQRNSTHWTDLRYPRYDSPASKEVEFGSSDSTGATAAPHKDSGFSFSNTMLRGGMAPVMTGLCGAPSGAPVPVPGLPTRKALSPEFGSSGGGKQTVRTGANMADTTSSSVSPFNFDTHAVRVVMCDDQPWFVATDVTDALGVDRTQSRRLDDDEKGVRLIHTPSGDQQMTVINESGLYSLILRSRKPEAKRFKKWVTSEVLPAIRKTGTYTVPTATISEQQCQHLQELVQLVVQSGKQTHGETWKRFHNKMKVASYRNLPAAQFESAVTYLKGKLDDETMLDLVSKHLADRMPAALEMAMVAASGVFTETVRQVLTAQDSPSMIRLMVGAQHVPGKGLQPMAHTVRHDQCLMSFNEMTKAVNEPGGLRLSNADLFGMLGAVTTELSDRNADQQARLAA